MAKDIKNVFISHCGSDDAYVSKLKELCAVKQQCTIRNSSIDSSKSNDAKNEEYIKTMLRKGIDWAGTTIVLIGPETHTRQWVNWEIEYSQKEGNRIVGVYIPNATDADVPEALQKYNDAIVGWDSGRIVDAIEGKCNSMVKPDGSPWSPFGPNRGEC